jgi:hypothetical protein
VERRPNMGLRLAHAPSLAVAGFLFAVFSSPILVTESLAQGFRFTFGFGTGSATIMCTACRNAGNVGGTTATFQFGIPATQHLQVGFTSDWWWHSTISTQGWDRQIRGLAASLFYYPWTVRHGLFIDAGPTYSSVLVAVTDSTALQRHGWGFTIGIGYDVRWRVSLLPRLAYSYAWVGDINYPLGSNVPFARGWKHEFVSLGLGLTLHERRASAP